jgi:hypothetical protein
LTDAVSKPHAQLLYLLKYRVRIMKARGKTAKPTKKTQSKGSKPAKAGKKHESLSEEDLRKVSGGIEPMVIKRGTT